MQPHWAEAKSATNMLAANTNSEIFQFISGSLQTMQKSRCPPNTWDIQTTNGGGKTDTLVTVHRTGRGKIASTFAMVVKEPQIIPVFADFANYHFC